MRITFLLVQIRPPSSVVKPPYDSIEDSSAENRSICGKSREFCPARTLYKFHNQKPKFRKSDIPHSALLPLIVRSTSDPRHHHICKLDSGRIQCLFENA